MNAVDWSKAPKGAVAYKVSSFGQFLWTICTASETSAVVAPDFGLEHGVYIRPSAAEADLLRITYDYCIESDWIEDDESDKRLPIERRLQAMVDQLKAMGAKNSELRAEVERLRGIVPETLEQLNDEICSENDQLRTELERARIPDGWRLVPIEFTQAMEDAGHAAYEKSLIGDRRDIGKAFRRRWTAMLAAAPSPGQQP